jgi:hypothetical protein
LSLGLKSSDGVTTFELRNASFHLTGPNELVLDAPDVGAPDAAVPDALEQELSVGAYTLELLPGWQLVAYDDQPERTLDARLLTSNPQSFDIAPNQTTTVSLQFETAPPEQPEQTGSLEIEIEVSQAMERALCISEYMLNPAVLADTAGEWFEVQNTGSKAIDLAGCSVSRDASSFTIGKALVIAPGEIKTFANSETPGFAPDYVYSSLTLPNSAAFTLSIQCGGEALDTIPVNPTTWPGGAGIAASLSNTKLHTTANDDPLAWCDASSSYNGDLGTPGGPNPACP